MDNKNKNMKIKIIKNGPYIVTGNIPLSEEKIMPKGRHYVYEHVRDFPKKERYSLCRCGHTKNPPYCDGSHSKLDFDGTEAASREAYAQRIELLEGPDLSLMDDNRCAFARFCHREEGDAWELTLKSDDPHLRNEAIIAASECPAGRLVSVNKEGYAIEPDLESGIVLLQDPERNVTGPLFVKGKITLESEDGFIYESRNRYTLCQCGKSEIKPFCDAMHTNIQVKNKK